MTKKAEKPEVVISLSKVKPVEFLVSGIEPLDAVLAWPRQRLSMVWGNPGAGKTHLALKTAAEASKAGHKVLYIDAENRINIERVKELGADPKKIDYSNLFITEQVGELIKVAVKKYDLVILDSIASLMPKAEVEGEVGEAHIGLRARRISQFLAQLDLATGNCALLVVNQLRHNIGQMYGPKYELPGGIALRFKSSMTVYLRSNDSSDVLRRDGKKTTEEIGRKVHASITKSSVGYKRPDGTHFAIKGQEAEFEIYY